MVFSRAVWLLLASIATAQQILPSNNSADIANAQSSPRFYINSTSSVQFPGFEIAPLGEYSQISRNVFLSISFSGVIVNTDASNVNQVRVDDFSFVSCDPEDYEGGNLGANSLLNIITSQQSSSTTDKSSLIFYSTRANHCNASNIDGLNLINGIFTTVDPVVAAQVANRKFNESSKAAALLTPDTSSYSMSSPGSGGGSSGSQPPTTAIAMIILYSITGVITAMFIVIIVTGAIRAHRHPERYGPRNFVGRARQSRAKGIARAMLETLPIVKFGDHHDLVTGAKNDVEMVNPAKTETAESKAVGDKKIATTTTDVGTIAATAHAGSSNSSTTGPATNPESSNNAQGASNADGSDDAGSLGCSICTEDFQKGEEVRVLPCNHKFHPDCVDPWLLNVSGTCPLCRISLQPGGEGQTQNDETMPPPLDSAVPFGDRRSQAIHNLMSIAYGSREERVTALRRYRAERRSRTINDDERLSRARRFKEAFRIRTRQHEPNATEVELRNTGIDGIAAPHTRM